MDVELKRILSILRNKSVLVNGVPTSETFSNITDSAEAVSDEIAKVPKSDAAVTWNATALASINAEVDTALNTIVPLNPTAGSLNDALSKAAGGNTFDKTTDSLEALSDKVALDSTVAKSAELDKVPKSDAAVTWNATALASINTEVDTALNTAVPVSPTSYSLNDILSAVSGANTFVKVTDSLEALGDITQAVQQAQNGQLAVHEVFNTTTTTKNATVILFELDAIGGAKRRVKLSFYLALDAAATFTITKGITRAGDLVTFTTELIPAIATITTPAANGVYTYDLGDVPEGLQMRASIAQDNLGAATVVCDATLVYEG